jgi:RimJ/RimL family protein N-acetyltransferase
MTDFTGFTAETERLRLRTYTDDDFDAFFDLHRREDVARYLPWHPRDEQAAREALARHQRLTVEVDDQGVTLAAFDKATERLVGDFVLILRSVEHRRGEVGYVLHPDFAGRGLATEGARVMLDIAFEKLGLRRVIGRIDARNQASARVLTKLGLRHEAHLVQNELFKGEWTDEDDFAILHDEWQKLRSGDVETAGTAPSQG